MIEYRFEKVDVTTEKIKLYADLLSAVFTETNKFSVDFLHWQYAENPLGKAIGFDAWLGNELAAHYVTIPVEYVINGKITKGVLSLNTATHKEHQGKGLFTKLAERTYEEAKALGYEFVIGVANQNSTYGFLKKLGFYLVAPLDVKIGFGKIKLHQYEEYYTLKANWTKQQLEWRLKCPANSYIKQKNTLLVNTGKYNIYAVLGQMNENFLSLKSEAKKPILKMWVGIAEKKSISPFYFKLPQKLRPSPLNLIFKDLNGGVEKFEKKDVLFELIDFDAY